MNGKLKVLKDIIAAHEKVIVAFSGGTDSAFILKISADVLGIENVVAVTAVSESYTSGELDTAKNFAIDLGVRHELLKTNELSNPDFYKNPPLRCYHCKKEFYSSLSKLQKKLAIKTVFDGTNSDDGADYRPGHAAARESGVKSPLQEAGFSKDEIRKYSKALRLVTWDIPSNPCLASRFPYGNSITIAKLNAVAKAEELLRSHGFKTVRVRHHEELARIELDPKDFRRIMKDEIRNEIYTELKKLGFTWISLDLKGYRSGSLNENLQRKDNRHTK